MFGRGPPEVEVCRTTEVVGQMDWSEKIYGRSTSHRMRDDV